jgi:hypothetical protein
MGRSVALFAGEPNLEAPMRAFAVLCVLFISACATTPAATAQAPPQGAIERCIAATTMDQAARRNCVGQVTRACIESEDGNSSTSGVVDCATAERTQWAALREQYIARLRARESESQRTMLDTMLTEHESWARTRCAYAASLYEGGSLARVLRTTCLRDAEAELVLDLAVRFDEF